jgi:hypothetical protein
MTDLWDRATTVQELPPPGVVSITAIVAVALIALPGAWPVARHVVTVAHEAGHALVAVLTGRRLTGIRLHSDTSGLTLSRGKPRGPGMALMLLAGHLGPAALGLGAALLLAQGHAVGLLWALLAVLAVMLLMVRNLFGLWVILVCGAGVAAVTQWASPQTQSAVAYALTWFWLLAAPRTVVELAAARRRGGARTSDADQLATVTRIPALFWIVVLLFLTIAAAVGGTALLLPQLIDSWR